MSALPACTFFFAFILFCDLISSVPQYKREDARESDVFYRAKFFFSDQFLVSNVLLYYLVCTHCDSSVSSDLGLEGAMSEGA